MKYSNEFTREISFPLGGIGTGSIGLDGSGNLVDWEIFNRPSKGSSNGYTHFAIKAIRNNDIRTFVIQSDIQKDFVGQYKGSRFTGYGFGPDSAKMVGFPHFKNAEFCGEFPVASINFSDADFPADIKMTAFNPFIPCDSKNSSIPAAFFEFEIKNTTDESISYQLAFSVRNPFEVSHNESMTQNGYSMIKLSNGGAEKSSLEYGDLTVATDCETSFAQSYWYRGLWMDSVVTYWNEFSSNGNLSERKYNTDGKFDCATLAAQTDVAPKSVKKIRFVLSWNVPNNNKYWSDDESIRNKHWKNYYATVFCDSVASANYALSNWNNLYERTILFKNTLHNSTLPAEITDAASSNISVLKSPTVLRLEDGSFYAWEGVHEKEGSCEGTCQHVWNYAYAMCYLFPDLELSIRNQEFRYSTAPDGRMAFRMMLPAGTEMSPNRACLDGQMGSVIKCYREWKLSGDNKWLSDNWDNIKKVLEYAWSDENCDLWDNNKDGVLEGRQHHTLDMELFGTSSWLQGMYMASLKAAAEIGEFLGDTQKAREYRDLFNKGYNYTKENLFNGSYFIHKIDLTDKNIIDKFDAADLYWNEETKEIKYQICDGSSIDQLLAQWHADIIGLGDIFDSDQTLTALKSMMKNNFKDSMRNFVNPWRIFSLYDEAGAVICDYPDGVKKPAIPISYCEETMTGFEYSFAGLLLSRGLIDDGLKVVKAIRDRYDGKKRNPWNEIECGSNYARSMASFALIPILSGFKADLPHKHIAFCPYTKTSEFSAFWAAGGSWGNFEIKGSRIKINVYEGSLSISSIGLSFCDKISSVKADGKSIGFTFENGTLRFDEIEISDYAEILI